MIFFKSCDNICDPRRRNTGLEFPSLCSLFQPSYVDEAQVRLCLASADFRLNLFLSKDEAAKVVCADRRTHEIRAMARFYC